VIQVSKYIVIVMVSERELSWGNVHRVCATEDRWLSGDYPRVL